EEMIKLGDLGADTPRQIVKKSKTLIFGSQSRGTYIDAEIDDMLASSDNEIDATKEDAKRQKRETDLLRRVVMSDDRMSHGAERGNGSGRGVDDMSGGDDDEGP
nr:hypothetical protein [Tanacetum cinerariifolium]